MGKLAVVGVITGHIKGQAEDMLGEVVGRGSVNSGPETWVLAWHSLYGQDAENWPLNWKPPKSRELCIHLVFLPSTQWRRGYLSLNYFSYFPPGKHATFQEPGCKSEDLVQSHQGSLTAQGDSEAWAEPSSLEALRWVGLQDAATSSARKRHHVHIYEGEGERDWLAFCLPRILWEEKPRVLELMLIQWNIFIKWSLEQQNDVFHIFHCLWQATLMEGHWGCWMRNATNCIMRDVCPLAQMELSPNRVLWGECYFRWGMGGQRIEK